MIAEMNKQFYFFLVSLIREKGSKVLAINCFHFEVSIERSSTGIMHETQLQLFTAPTITVNKSILLKN